MIDFPEELLEELEIEEEEQEEIHSECERQALHSYGPFHKDGWYRFLESNMDWMAFRVSGQKVYAPKWVFNG